MADRNDPMNDQAIDRALREALDVSPSRDFVARVRMRIANEPARHNLWNRWTVWPPVAAGALAAAAIVVAVVLGSIDRIRPTADTTTSVNATSATDVQLKSDATTARPKPDAAPEQVRLKPDATLGRVRLTPDAAAAVRLEPDMTFSKMAAEPEVLVPRAEIEMYQRLTARARAARSAFVDAPTLMAADLEPPPELTIEPIKIDPITPQSSGEGERQ